MNPSRIALGLAIACSSSAWSASISEAEKAFAIEPQRADSALLQFAEQANLSIVFPVEKVQDISTNSLHGKYSIEEGIQRLLAHTRLQAKISETGQIQIQVQNQDSAEDAGQSTSTNLLQRLLDFFTPDEVMPKSDKEDYETIVIKGIRSSVHRAVAVKQDSNLVVDAIMAEDIGKFPDQNLAESLQRVSGVSIDRAEGEGQFVTVRGFGPEFNRVQLNGRQIATDNQGREFSFDILASELVNSVQVFKTQSASMASGGIGSTININTAKPLSQHGFRWAGSVKAHYDDNRQETSPELTALFSNTFDDNRFGVLVSYAQQERSTRIDEAQIDGWLPDTNIPDDQLQRQSNHIFVPRNYDQRVRFDNRKRQGGTLVLQYQPNESFDITLDYLHSSFDVNTDVTSMGHWFTSSNLENVLTDSNGTVVEFEQNIGHATDFHAKTFDRPSSLNALGSNIKWHISDRWQINLDWSHSVSTLEDKQGAGDSLSLIGYLNRSHFDHSSGNILPAINGFESASANIINAEGIAAGVSHYLDPANGKAHVFLLRGWDIRDQINQWRIDNLFDINGDWLAQIDIGFQLSKRKKRNQRWDNEANAAHCTFCGYDSTPDIPDDYQWLFDAGEGFLSGISGHENIPHQWLRHDQQQLLAFLQTNTEQNLNAQLRSHSFSVQEDISAGYINAHWQQDWQLWDFSMQTGVRFEQTDVSVSGTESPLLELVILDQTELGQITAPAVETLSKNRYHHWLPALNLKLEYDNNWVFRGAISKTLTRPTISQLSPALVLDTTRQGGDLRASSGNPALRPFESFNIDMGIEYYYQYPSYISANYFRKRVKHFILSNVDTITFPGVTDPSTGINPNEPDEQDSLAEFDHTYPQNAETAVADGFEFSLMHQFGDSGFGVLANMTLIDSNAELNREDVSRKFALTGLSDSKNVILYYEKAPWQWRLAWNSRDAFLQSLTQKRSAEPTFVAPYQQWDMSMSYDINDHLTLVLEGINLTNEVVHKHGRYSNQLLLIQDTGTAYSLGIRGVF
ncbi:TonB-dependent receptor [Paraneptunicella aestuarii]|uniref:TonB-dependent receptor n=1 Tax=Paraneptunicella aestuarii TaxID=2831148 RepID=UPI001E3DC064|nr:TonB-dependent receptor [Paraneptunicella aestuarii]UAA40390.1 TonB-dependent receptor [Paraneptunicella aestuarii]